MLSVGGGFDCPMCGAITIAANIPIAAEFSAPLGTIEDLLCHNCGDHKDLLRTMLEGGGKMRWPQPVRDLAQAVLLTKKSGSSALEFTCGRRPIFPLEIITRTYDEYSIGRGKLVDPDWIDASTFRRWYQTCCSSHGAVCENPVLLESLGVARPAYLIDT